MNLALFYDTETQGLPLFSEPSEDPRQPHIVQLAALLVDLDSRKTIGSVDVIVKPDGWEIPAETAAIHGITTERAMDVGVSEKLATEMLLDLWGGRTRIAHNEPFDARILRIAIKRLVGDTTADAWKAGRAECTARMATPVCAIPPTDRMRAVGRNHYKTPNLGEAVSHILKSNLVSAHTAMGDVLACRDVYFALTAAPDPAAGQRQIQTDDQVRENPAVNAPAF